METIIVTGCRDAGKTTIVNEVYNRLKEFGAKELDGYNVEQVGYNERDFKCIVEFGRIKVAFFSMGDEVSPVCEALKTYSELSCDFAVIANRNFKSIKNAAKKYSTNVYDKDVSSSMAINNIAHDIVNILQRFRQ